MDSERYSVGFFAALLGVCRGTFVFGRLIHQSIWRTLLHLFILTVLCGLWISSQNSEVFDQMVERPQRMFIDNFGGLKLDARGLVPVKTVKSPDKMEINSNLQLIYCEQGDDFQEDLLRGTVPANTLLWFPTALGVAVREDGSSERKASYKVFLAKFGEERSFEVKSIPGQELRAFWKEEVPDNFDVDSDTAAALSAVTLEAVLYSMKMLYLTMLFLGVGFEILFYALFLSLFSALILSATSARRRVFDYGQLFKLGIYAGFPAMIVGSFFPAWQLPYLQYPMVYSFGMVIYCSVVLRSLERASRTEEMEDKK